jgi:1,4-alpha-glucan branching enzyme
MKKRNFSMPALVKEDTWLEPVAEGVWLRQERFRQRLSEIENDYGSLLSFADGHKHFGIIYDTKRKGWMYREWAPGAFALHLIGDFNNWNYESHPMEKNPFGIWEIFLPEQKYKSSFVHGSKIKVLVDGANGRYERIPAYIRRVVQDDNSKNFSGQMWFPEPFDWQGGKSPVFEPKELIIYECHPGMAQEKLGVGSWNEFAGHILPRIKAAGYNAIQMMAVMEHPYYGSFGYHVSNFFAPSSRFGTPEDLKSLVKKAHEMGLAVIMDMIHSHTVKNYLEGINAFDGTDFHYSHGGERGNHPHWDSRLFDYGKTEVLRFLLSNIKYWMQEFRFDGFRFDGVGSMMYFHFGNINEFNPWKYFTDGVEFDAVTYLQLANKLVHTINSKAITIAEDVTGMPGLTNPIRDGGIGFDYRLGMGIPDFWVATLKNKRDEDWSVYEIWNMLTDQKPGVKTVAYCESHDQALVGDKTLAFWLMDKEMYDHMHVGDRHPVIERGIALHKMIRLVTLALGGQAYLNFIGNEFGHPEWVDFPREGNNWSYWYARRQWSLADNPELKYQFLAAFDRGMLQLIKNNHILLSGQALQLNLDEANKTLIFEKGGLIFVFNFHVFNSIPDYEFMVPEPGKYQIVLSSDNPKYGGWGRVDESIDHFSYSNPASGLSYLRIYNINRAVIVFKKSD